MTPVFSWMRRKLWLVPVVAILLYGLYAWAMYEGQERSIYVAAYYPAAANTAADPPPPARRVEQQASDGLRLLAWYQPGAGRTAARPGPAVIFFHGNCDTIADRWYVAQQYTAAGLSGLLFEYRGYGAMEGQPSQLALTRDAIQWIDWLAAQPEVDPQRIVLHGISLGGGIAVQAAAERPPAAMILESTFTSITALCQRLGLPSVLCRHPFRSDRIVPRLDLPILVVHGSNDWLIPASHGRRLSALARNATYIETDAGHADYQTHWDAVWAHLRQHGLLGD